MTAFEQRDTLERCREIYHSLANEPFARLIDADASAEQVTARLTSAVKRF